MSTPTIVQRVNSLAVKAANEDKALHNLINGKLADLSTLSTTEKGNLLLAINWLHTQLQNLASGAAGIDDSVTVNNKTWSSSKTQSVINATSDAILGGAGPAFDTLEELRVLINAAEESDIISALTTTVGQKANAADVYTKAEIGDLANADFVAAYNTARNQA